jgi:hypothetical protein
MQINKFSAHMKKILYGLIVFFAFHTEGGYAQQSRFRATAIGGVNLSQIDGDFQEGYRRKNVCIGLSSAVIFRPDFDISLEAFYNPRGAQPLPEGTTQQTRYRTTIDLKYADVVALLNFHAFPHKSKLYYVQSLKIGMSYGRLLNSSVAMRYNNLSFAEYEQQIIKGLRKDDIAFILGLGWQLSPQFGFMFRHSYSIRAIYQKKESIFVTPPSFIPIANRDINYLKPYYISLHTFFHFVSPHKAVGVRRNKIGGGGDPLEEL